MFTICNDYYITQISILRLLRTIQLILAKKELTAVAVNLYNHNEIKIHPISLINECRYNIICFYCGIYYLEVIISLLFNFKDIFIYFFSLSECAAWIYCMRVKQ